MSGFTTKNNNNKNNNMLASFLDSYDDEKILYTNDDIEDYDKQNLSNEQLNSIILDFINSSNGRISMRQINQIYESLKNNEEPTNNKLKELYNDIKNNNNINKIFNLNNGSLIPIFNTETERQVFYICGMSGCGKSTLVSQLIEKYSKQFKNNKIYFFSNKKADPVIDKHKKVIRININDELVEDPIDLNELKHSLVVYDDIEFIPNKLIAQELDRIRDLILQQGRSYGISFCYISHQLTNYKHSRIILNECHSVFLFPRYTTKYSLTYLLETYFGLNKNQISKLKTLPSRWVMVSKIPNVICHQNGAYYYE